MTARKRNNPRNAQLAAIHVAKKQLGLDDDTYRAMLWAVARVESAADLDAYGRRQVLDHMRSRGATRRPRGGQYPGRPHNTDANAQMKKIEALLTDMRLPWSYADSIARQMYRVERVAWLHGDQLGGVITALIKEQVKRGLA